MATLLSDNFDRANSASVLGSPQVGPAPTSVVNSFGIASNQAYAGAVPAMAVYDLGTANVQLTCTLINDAGSLIFGFVDNANYWLVYFTANAVYLYQTTAGNAAVLYTATTAKYTASNPTVCRAHYRDGIIRAYVNDVLAARWVLDVPITGTKHGFRSTSTVTRFDNLLGEDAPVITEATATGNFMPVDRAPSTEPDVAFLYKGNDTKLQDQAAGA